MPYYEVVGWPKSEGKVPYKNKGDIQNCANYPNIKLLSNAINSGKEWYNIELGTWQEW